MENSTKALLISGAVLIVLLSIGLAMGLINSTQPLYDEVEVAEQSKEAKIFNSQFLPYLKNPASPDEVRDLITKIMKHNVQVNPSSSFSAGHHQIHINLKDNSGNHLTDPLIDDNGLGHNYTTVQLKDIYNKISDKKTYRTYVTHGCTTHSGGYYNGYIICISISENP